MTFHRHLDVLATFDGTAQTLLVLLQCVSIVFRARITSSLALGESANRLCVDAFAVPAFHHFDETNGFGVAQRHRQACF